MATTEDIAALRLFVAEPSEDPYTDAALSARIDEMGDLNAVAVEIWTEKAARYAALVDVSEGGSSRKMSDLQEQALKMVGVFGARVEVSRVVPPRPVGTIVSRIRRG